MRKSRALQIVGLALVALVIAANAPALSNRVFLAPLGNDASDCANPLTPCLTFAGALRQVNPGSEVIAEATGGYGPLNVTQAVTISGPPGVVMYTGLQVNVNAPGATVVFRGLTIDGTGAAADGINVAAVGTLHVESCVITGFTGSDISHGNGIFFGAPGSLFMNDTIIRGNSYVGLWIVPATGTATASIDNSRFEGNGYGVDAFLGTVTTVRDSVATGNGYGFLAEVGEINIENCVSANNNVGIHCHAGVARVSNTTVTGNASGLVITTGGSLLSRQNNTVEGNAINGTFSGTYSAK